MEKELKHKLATYKPAPTTVTLINGTSILFLVGISGAGKDSIKHELLKSDKYHQIVSHTTRSPRANRGIMERDGLEYHFIDLEQAKKMIESQAFVEAKMYSGNIYGTSVAEIQAAHDNNKIALTDIEVQGVAEYKAIASQVKAAFILPPSYEVWQLRIKARYGESLNPEDYRRRMQAAVDELEQLLGTDYYKCFVNDDLATVVEEVDRFATISERDNESEAHARELAESLLAKVKQELQVAIT